MNGKLYKHDDLIFKDFTKISKPGLVFILDADTSELVFAARITTFAQMEADNRAKFELTFKYFASDYKRMHGATTRNGAMHKGKMGAIGWRAPMGETTFPHQVIGTYAMGSAAKKNPKDWLKHIKKEIEICNIYRESYLGLAPLKLKEQALQRATLGVPGFAQQLPGSSLDSTSPESSPPPVSIKSPVRKVEPRDRAIPAPLPPRPETSPYSAIVPLSIPQAVNLQPLEGRAEFVDLVDYLKRVDPEMYFSNLAYTFGTISTPAPVGIH